MPIETLLVRTLVELTDTLVDDFDVVELLTLLTDRSIELFDVSAAGLLLISPEGELCVMASSSDAMRVVELFELQNHEGPCFDSFHSGEQVIEEDLTTSTHWPLFAPVALSAGFRSVHAMPMRLRGKVLGALNLFSEQPGKLSESDVTAVRALADVATIAILQQRAAEEAHVLNTQLNYALTSRVMIEQAKGILSERLNLDMEQAFARLRNHARNHHLGLNEVAQSVVNGTLVASAIDGIQSVRF